MREIHHILFDLDGTLIDSSGAIRASLDHALRGNGLCAVAVSWGFGPRAELTAAGPDHLVDCCSELPGLLLQRAPGQQGMAAAARGSGAS